MTPAGPEEHSPRDDAPAPAAPRLGVPGARLDRQSWFMRGLAASAGAAVVVTAAWLVIQIASELVLVGLALFIAIGLDPAVLWLQRRRLRRSVAVTAVLVVAFGAVAGFLATAIPVAVAQATQAATLLPEYLRSPQGRDSLLGRLESRFQFEQIVERIVTADGGATVLGAGEAVAGGVVSTVIVLALVVYFLADLPRLRRTGSRFVPASRRSRVALLAQHILAKVGGYVLGSLVLAVIAGAATLVILLVLGVQYALLLAMLVALLDLIPVLGSTLGGVIVVLVGLSVSTPTGIILAVFFVTYRVIEDYVLLPRIIGRTVQVPAVVTLVAVVLGAGLLGPVGAIVAIPVAAAALLLLREVVYPHFDRI